MLKRAVRHLAAKDVTVFVERDDHCAAELAEPGIKVGLLIFGMILFGEHQHHRGFIAKGLAPMRRHVSQLRLLAVPLEDARHRRLYVGGWTRLFRRRQRFPSAEQRHVETYFQTRGKHPFGFIRLTGFPNRPPILQL